MRKLACLLLAILAVGLPGCDQDVYEIQLTPQGRVIERRLTVWHGGYQTDETGQTKRRVASAIDPEKLAKLADIYGQEPKRVAENVHSFVGTFSEQMPDDLGGAGNYTYLPSTMGPATFYIERFGGNDDVVAGLDEQKAAQWDAFLESLQPGESLISRLQGFRFESEPTTAPAEEGAEPPKPYELSAAKDQIERILVAISKEPETTPAE